MSVLRKTISTLLRSIDEARTSDFSQLAEIAGLNPATDFVGADLRGVNLSGVDFARFNFAEADLTGAILPPAPIPNKTDTSRVPKLVSRQGDRLAQALDELLCTGEVPKKDGRQTSSLARLRNTSIELRALASLYKIGTQLTEKGAIQVLSRALGPVMGPNRGVILYDFANRLAKYPLIRQFLQEKLNKSHAYSIRTIYSAIQERLDAPLRAKAHIMGKKQNSGSVEVLHVQVKRD